MQYQYVRETVLPRYPIWNTIPYQEHQNDTLKVLTLYYSRRTRNGNRNKGQQKENYYVHRGTEHRASYSVDCWKVNQTLACKQALATPGRNDPGALASIRSALRVASVTALSKQRHAF